VSGSYNFCFLACGDEDGGERLGADLRRFPDRRLPGFAGAQHRNIGHRQALSTGEHVSEQSCRRFHDAFDLDIFGKRVANSSASPRGMLRNQEVIEIWMSSWSAGGSSKGCAIT